MLPRVLPLLLGYRCAGSGIQGQKTQKAELLHQHLKSASALARLSV